jgi:hypothetical protein
MGQFEFALKGRDFSRAASATKSFAALAAWATRSEIGRKLNGRLQGRPFNLIVRASG